MNKVEKFLQSYLRHLWHDVAVMSDTDAAAWLWREVKKLSTTENPIAASICEAALDEVDWFLIAKFVKSQVKTFQFCGDTVMVSRYDVEKPKSTEKTLTALVNGKKEDIAVTIDETIAVVKIGDVIRFYSYPELQDTGW